MRISEAAKRLGSSPRMLRYREELGLLPTLRDRFQGHRVFAETELAAIAVGLELEQRYDITPAALAFGLRVATEPSVRGDILDLARRLGRVPATPSRALDFEKERALRALRPALAPRVPPPPTPSTPPTPPTPSTPSTPPGR